jgi:formylmethanofuran dehydrogenase subunit E
MNSTQISLDIKGVQRFHGHFCPGLSMGIRISEIVLREIGPHSSDEEVVCIAETDNCALDAIQYFTGCSAGKGNLIQRDYGKNVFTFVRRSDGKAIRISARPAPKADEGRRLAGTPAPQSREERIQAILSAPIEELFEVRQIEIDMPEKARILNSIPCAECGEATMSTRVRYFRGQLYCIPCFEVLTQER